MTMLVLSMDVGVVGQQLAILTPQGEVAASLQSGGSGGARALPALDAHNVLAWDFQVLQSDLPPTLGTLNQDYKNTGSLFLGDPSTALSSGFTLGTGGGAAVLGPGGAGLAFADSFYASGGNIGGTRTPLAPPSPPDNTSITVEAYFNLLSQTTSTQGVIISKAFSALWFAPFNAFEMNLQVGNVGAIEYGMVDSSVPGTEIGATVSGRDALLVGWHHVAVVIDQALRRAFIYVDGVRRGFFTFTDGILLGTGPWMIGGNAVNASDSSNIQYSRVTVSNIARDATYIANAAAGWLRS